jgi:hypothetical protein
MRVVTAMPDGDPREDIILAALEPGAVRTASADGTPLLFQGRLGVVATRGAEVVGMSLVGGGELQYGGAGLSGDGEVSARIVEVLPESDAIVIETEPGSAPVTETLIGLHARIDGDGYRCPSTYTVTGIEPAAGARYTWRLNMTQVLAHGVIKAVDGDGGAFSTQTPVMKLRVNPGLFDGKPVRGGDGPMHRLATATEGAFTVAEPAALNEFRTGGSYTVYDIGVGDTLQTIDFAGTDIRR